MTQTWIDGLAAPAWRANSAVAAGPDAQFRRWELALVALLLGLQFTADQPIDGARLRLELLPLAPLVSAWAVLRLGAGVIPGLVAYALLPRFGFQAGGFGLAWTPPAMAGLLVGAVVGAWWSAQLDSSQWKGLWHVGRWPLALVAFGLLVFGALEWPPIRLPVEGLSLRFSPPAFLAVLALLFLPRWRAWSRLARDLGGKPLGFVTLVLPFVLVGMSATSASVNIAGAWLSVGVTSGLPMAVALLAAGLLWAWPRPRAWAAAVALMVLVEVLRRSAGQPPLASAWIPSGAELRWLSDLSQSWDALCNALAVALVVVLLKTVGPKPAEGLLTAAMPAARNVPAPKQEHPSGTGWTFWLVAWLAALALLVLPALLGASQSEFLARDTRGWLLGALAFVLVAAYGLPALICSPVALGALAAAGLLPSVAERVEAAAAAHVLGVVALAASWAFVGWLVHRARTRPAKLPAPEQCARVVPIDGLGRLVHRLDVSATLSSFGVLLTVLLVGLGLVQTGVIGFLMQAFGADAAGFDWGEDWLVVMLVVLASAMAAVLPMSFLVVDAANRADRMQAVSAFTGAVVAAPLWVMAAFVVAALWAGTAVWLIERGTGQLALALLSGVWASVLLVTCAGRAHGFGGRAAATLVLPLLPGLLWGAGRLWGDAVANVDPAEDASLPLQLAGSLMVLALLVATFVRALRLRADLALPLPRHWLFGAIPGGSFWARLAALMGMPASMWRRLALREPALWLLLLARPLVYAGAGALLTSRWWLGLAGIVAGHASLLVGKQLAARAIWRPEDAAASPQQVLFLRGFDDDQFDFRLRGFNPVKRWLALWSFRRNLDEALVDEIACYGSVVALGRPGQTQANFGAARHYARHEDWQTVVLQTARSARAIVIAAGNTPGVLWEYEMLRGEGLLERTLLLFHPGASAAEGNRAALEAFPMADEARAALTHADAGQWVALLHQAGHWALLTSAEATSAHYVLALRLHFQGADISSLSTLAALLPAPRWPAVV